MKKFIILILFFFALFIDSNVYALTATIKASIVLPSTQKLSEAEKKKGNRTFNLQDFDFNNDYFYFTRQQRGSCTKSKSSSCSSELRKVNIYRYKIVSSCDSIEKCYVDSKEWMALKNSGHGTAFHLMTKPTASGTKQVMVVGQSDKSTNSGNRVWNSKWIGTSKYYSIINYETSANYDITGKTSFDPKGDYIYDIGINESSNYFSVRDNNVVYIYKYSFDNSNNISFKYQKTISNIDTKVGVQGHDIDSAGNIYIIDNNGVINKYNYSDGKKSEYKKITKANLESGIKKITGGNPKINKYEYEGLKRRNGNIYIGAKIKLKSDNYKKTYSIIFKID